ncbi:MAG: hypothetical protein ACYC3H_03535 [Bellilinea sp.]
MTIKYRPTSEILEAIEKTTLARGNILARIEQLKREEVELKDLVGEEILSGKAGESSAKLEKVQRDIINNTLALGPADSNLVLLDSELSNAKAQEGIARWKQVHAEMVRQVNEIESLSAAQVDKAAQFKKYLIAHRPEVVELAQDSSITLERILTVVERQLEAETLLLKEIDRVKSSYLKAE